MFVALGDCRYFTQNKYECCSNKVGGIAINNFLTSSYLNYLVQEERHFSMQTLSLAELWFIEIQGCTNSSCEHVSIKGERFKSW